MSLTSTPTAYADLVDAIDAVANVQDPMPWDANYFWPPVRGNQPQLVGAYLTAEQDVVRLVFDTPLDDVEPDDQNFVIERTDDAENVQPMAASEVSLSGDYTVQLEVADTGSPIPGIANAQYLGTVADLVVSADGKEALPGKVPLILES